MRLILRVKSRTLLPRKEEIAISDEPRASSSPGQDAAASRCQECKLRDKATTEVILTERIFGERRCEDSESEGVQSDHAHITHCYSRPHPSVRVSFARGGPPGEQLPRARPGNAREARAGSLSRRPSSRLSSNNYNSCSCRGTKHWTKKPRRRFPTMARNGALLALLMRTTRCGAASVMSIPCPVPQLLPKALLSGVGGSAEAAGEREGELKVKLAESQASAAAAAIKLADAIAIARAEVEDGVKELDGTSETEVRNLEAELEEKANVAQTFKASLNDLQDKERHTRARTHVSEGA